MHELKSSILNNKMSILEAAAAGAWLHGDIAKKYGRGLISEDIVKGIPEALRRLADGRFTKKRNSKKSTRIYKKI